MIEAEQLSKTFRVPKKLPGLKGSLRALIRRDSVEREAVKSATFHVGEGEIVGLVGANGAGKTTLVKMLAGIIHPTSGTARVLGHVPWRRDNALRRQMALIMGQKAQLWWDLPAADCFLLLKEIYQLAEPVFRANLDYLTAVLGVRDQLHVQIRRLSLGERMKMELIAALLHGPRVVYLDEPTIGLDLTAQRAIRDFLLRYREEHRPAMLLTSHYMEDIERLCRRIIILRAGEIVYDGSLSGVADVYSAHKIVGVHLRKIDGELPRPDFWRAYGEVERCEPHEVRLRVPRQQVASAAAALLAALPVADLSIEEVDIATVIEELIRERQK